MPSYFLDTSALAKHYHSEIGTAEVERILNEQGSTHFISRLTTVEIQSVFAGKVRTHAIALQDLQQLQTLFSSDLGSRRFSIVRMIQSHYQEAERLIRKYSPIKSLRTLDSIQLATALDFGRKSRLDYFVCADSRLCAIAQDEGLSVINPDII